MKEEVLNYLKDKKTEVLAEEIADSIGLDVASVEEILNKLEEDLVVFKTKKHRYILFENSKTVKKCVVFVTRYGDAYCEEVGGPQNVKYYVPKQLLKKALHKDIVAIELVAIPEEMDHSRRPSNDEQIFPGQVIKILKRDLDNLVGEIKKGKDGLYFELNDRRELQVVLDEEDLKTCVEGEILVVEPSSDLGNNRYIATIKTRLGHKDDAGIDIKMVCAKHDVFDEFPDDVIEQLDEIPDEISDKDKVGRVDLTDKMIFTIDGKDTKDIDDAISLEMTNDGNYKLGVHIADVSHYVTEGSPLDKEAYKRGTSCYPPGSVIPMLPHKLSNGICSLNEGVERCALTCEMIINGQGKIKGYEIYPSVIKSAKKMNYDDVNSVIEKDIVPEGYEPFAETLKNMLYLSHQIRADRQNRGASDFDIQEAKVICDENGVAVDVVCRERGEGERLIEDFMIAANETVARSYDKQYGANYPGVFRVHETPSPDKVQAYINFCESMGYHITGSYKNINYKTFQSILSQIHSENEVENGVLKSMAVRSMPKAFYSSENLGHYGLASKCYTHFTSPIRRYPDLQTHRLLRTYFFENRTDQKTINYYASNLPAVCMQCSDREVKAAEAEREAVKMKMAEYMESHVGEEFDGIVTDVTASGFYVQLDNLVSGKVSLSSLDGHFDFDDKTKILKSNKTIFRIGEKMRVKCTSANKEMEMIDFEIVKVEDLENNNSNNNDNSNEQNYTHINKYEKTKSKKHRHGRN